MSHREDNAISSKQGALLHFSCNYCFYFNSIEVKLLEKCNFDLLRIREKLTALSFPRYLILKCVRFFVQTSATVVSSFYNLFVENHPQED